MAFVPFVESDQPTMAAFNEKFQQNYEAALDADLKVAFGNYIGTGKSGEATPNSLTFPFEPKFVFVMPNDLTDTHRLTLVRGVTDTQTNDSYAQTVVNWRGNTVEWYYREGTRDYAQMNDDTLTYYYFAIG